MAIQERNDAMIDLLQSIAGQDKESRLVNAMEDFSDNMLMAEMELARARKYAQTGQVFVPRELSFPARVPMHPADLL